MREENCEPKAGDDSSKPQVTVRKLPKPPPPEQKDKPAPAANEEPAKTNTQRHESICSSEDSQGGPTQNTLRPAVWSSKEELDAYLLEKDEEEGRRLAAAAEPPPATEDASALLVTKYGEPFYRNKTGAITTINEAYWAGLHADECVLLHEPDEKTFYQYNGTTGIFEVESPDAIRTKISARLLEASRQANAFDLQKKRSASTLNNVIAHLRGMVEQRGAFSEKRKVIHLANGVMVFTGSDFELVPFSPEFRSRNRSPIAFDETATCDRFLNELVLPAVHPEDVELLQKFAGMFLLGYNRAQRLLILDGEGGRGKTQFANVMQGLVGMPNVTQLRTKHLAERFELFRFLKKTLLVGVDVEADFLSTKGAAVLKGLVGGDWHDAEQKGGTGCFQIQGIFNAVITSNARLRVRLQGDLSAWKRRLTIVRYEAPQPAKKIPDFGAYLLRTEGSGILLRLA